MGNIYNTASTARRASLWFCVRRLEKKRLLTPLPGLPLMTGVCVCRANYSSRSLAVSVRKTAALGPRRDGATIDRSPPASPRGHVQTHARSFFSFFYVALDVHQRGAISPSLIAWLVSAGVRKMHQIKQPL